MILVSLDIQSAYDRLWHAGLIQKLSRVGVPAAIVGWIASFLSGRVAHVRVGTAVATQHLDGGAPQGSPLSPILFLVYVNDLLDSLDTAHQALSQAFADDLVAWWTVLKGTSGEEVGTAVAQQLESWAERWRMVFNPAKCKVLIIGRIRDPPPTFLQIGRAHV